MNIDCTSSTYSWAIGFNVVFILLYPIGIPLTFGLLLWRNRRALSANVVEPHSMDFDAFHNALKGTRSYPVLKKLREIQREREITSTQPVLAEPKKNESTEQRLELEALFQSMNADGDDIVSVAEFKNFAIHMALVSTACAASPTASIDLQQFRQCVRTSESLTLSKTEEHDLQVKVKDLFERLDEDKSGCVSAVELSQIDFYTGLGEIVDAGHTRVMPGSALCLPCMTLPDNNAGPGACLSTID